MWSVQGAGTAAAPYQLIPYGRVNNQTFGGMITSGVLNTQTFNQNGVLSAFSRGAATGTNGIEQGGDGIWYDTGLKTGARSHQLFARFDFDVTDKLHTYLEAAGNDKFNPVYTTWSTLNNVTISRTNAYLPVAIPERRFATRTQASFTFRKSMLDVPRNLALTRERQVFFNGGVEGEFGNGYKWNLGLVHSTAQLSQAVNNLNNGRLFASLDATQVTAANVGATGLAIGSIVCNVALTNPGLYPGCVPLNPFGPTTDSADAVNYYRNRTSFVAHTRMDDVGGSMSGTLFSTWAGPVNSALSGEWRKVTYRGDSEAVPTDLLNCTGLRFNPCTSGTTTTWNGTIAPRSEVSQTVSEGAFEFDLPLLKDKFLAQSLNLNGAVRYTSYSTSGNYTTWKAGVDWHINDTFRLRTTRSRDIRAPTLDDLYSPTSVSTGGTFNDPLTGLIATNVTSTNGGNDKLKAEQGDTWTGGLVIRPARLAGFSMAVDYFNIRVTNALLQLLPINATWQKTCVDSLGTSLYCQLFDRPLPYTNTTAANNVTAVHTFQVNIAEQDTNGVDLEFNYARTLFGRPASARLLSTYQPNILYRQPAVVTINQGGAAFGTNGVTAAPLWRHTMFLRFSPFENFNVDLQTRYRTSLRLSGDPSHVISTGRVPPNSFTNLSLTYRVMNAMWQQGDVFLTVTNLFDKEASPAGFYGGQGIPGQQTTFLIYDDALGRAFTVGLRARF